MAQPRGVSRAFLIEIQTAIGPIDDQGLKWIGDLYGRSDPKYGRYPFLHHLFVDNPYGWAVHAFARAADEVVGHCAVIPVRARLGGELTMSGKVEAFVVDERYRRGRSAVGDRSIADELLTAVSEAAERRGVDPLHAYVSPHVGVIFERNGYTRRVVGPRAYAIIGPTARAAGPTQRVLTRLAASGQRTLAAMTMGEPALVRDPRDEDSQLVEVTGLIDSWTVDGADSWEWFTQNGFIAALELPGAHGGLALVCMEADDRPIYLLGWRPGRPGLRSGVRLLAALARLAHERSLPSVRVQAWQGAQGLGSACRAMALVPRERFTLYVRSSSAVPAPSPSPFFYATF